MRSRPVIAIDGPAGVGKSTVAKGVALKLGYAYVDTGALYRSVALLADRNDVSWDDPMTLAKLVQKHRFEFNSMGGLILDGDVVGGAIRTPRMSQGASAVAVHQEVRSALLGIQRELGKNGGVVLEGRDIGTSVFPDAEVKFFLTASQEIRAKRRFVELSAKGLDITYKQVLEEQYQRDENDQNRAVSPLLKAKDALEVVTDQLTADEVIEKMVRKIQLSFPLTSK